MTAIKCKICGGDVSVSEGKTFGTCEYCGSTITLPKVSDEQRLALFNRGNHFRRIGEFDKALAIYENIVREDDADAEAHWCCAISRFGIEYVEDPNTFEYLPTCHRASFDSFLEDVDFKAALEHSDGLTRRQYQKDAAKIAEVQRGILATSQNEEPYDVFICYKETDDQTKERTKDSVDAQEIYYQLTQEGYRVFFSRITLEDKAGTEYEPYIFAALNSAKVMIVIGSKPEYFNAVWVKNEWSRFLSMMRKDRSKVLLPCYKDMDPYDLPEQLSVLQSYDMTKIGFIQDLLRGVHKIVEKETGHFETPQASAIDSSVALLGVQTTALLKRGYMSLEDRDYIKANDFFEQVLNYDPECGSAYWGKTMCHYKCSTINDFCKLLLERIPAKEENITYVDKPLLSVARDADQMFNYLSAYSDEELSSAFEGYKPLYVSYKDRTKYFIENIRKYDDLKELIMLVQNRDFERAIQYKNDEIQDNLSSVQEELKALIKQEIEHEQNEKEKLKKTAINEEVCIKNTFCNLLKEMTPIINNVKQEVHSARDTAEKEAEKIYQRQLDSFEKKYQDQMTEWQNKYDLFEKNYNKATEKYNSIQSRIKQLEDEAGRLTGRFNLNKKRTMEGEIIMLRKQLREVLVPEEPGGKPEKGVAPQLADFLKDLPNEENEVRRIVLGEITSHFQELRSEDMHRQHT